jgi:CRP-like cAMP-binding protein
MTECANMLLSTLSTPALRDLQQVWEPVNLNAGDVLHEPFQPIEYLYFFEGGLSSEIVTDSEGEKIEVGCIGKEGFSGFPVALGVPSSPHRAFMEIGGPAKRVPSSEIRTLIKSSPDLNSLLLRSIHVFMIQVAATALADGRYEIHQRLARWLLMAHDRIESDNIALTHDFLALMLGVRRAGVTNAMHILEGDHLIRADRGLITIRDRPRLEKLAGGCYGAPEAEFRRVILGEAHSSS